MKKLVAGLIAVLLAGVVCAEEQTDTEVTLETVPVIERRADSSLEAWEPPRLVDGVWVTSGVSDEQAEEFAREEREAKEEEAWWQWYEWEQQRQYWASPEGNKERKELAAKQQQAYLLQEHERVGTYLKQIQAQREQLYGHLPSEYRPGIPSDEAQLYLWWDTQEGFLQKHGQLIGGYSRGGVSYGPPGQTADTATRRAATFYIPRPDGTIFIPPPMYSGPSIDGMSMGDYVDRQENRYRWETGQYKYPDWVLTE